MGGSALSGTSSGGEGRADAAPGLALPGTLAGMTLAQLRDDYHDRIFRQYLPFWDKGAYDRRYGGFICELNDDGSVASPEKYIWYQGRAVWVYSFLYNRFGRDRHWLDIARHTRDFMLRHMYAGQGRWFDKVRPDGAVLEGVGHTVYGWLFAAAGLGEYYLAVGDSKDLELVKESVRAALAAYDEPGYADEHTTLYTGLDLPARGLRSQGHSMVTISALTRLLAHHPDDELEHIQRRHVDHIVHDFWNPEYGIQNEYLQHDFSRAAPAAGHMLSGHSVETLWMIMDEARRRRDRTLFDTAKSRVRRILEMCWDHVFGGFGDGNFNVFGSQKHVQGPDFNVKTMWAQCEAMVASMLALQYTAEPWAADWYQRVRQYTLKTMPVPAHGVWRQAVDRFGKDVKRVGVSTTRKDNFHQVRYLMLNLLRLDEILAHALQTSPLEFTL
jgi:mannose/cellobiose epimerase-like protein (N-acyl-D-glucosamine 2-epimerase family)